MSRVINIKVDGEIIKKDSKNAGVQGEANATTLHFVFDESWSGYSKRVVWLNAMGESPVAVILYRDVTDAVEGVNPLEFESYIPGEALTEEGLCSFTIEGYKESAPLAISRSATEYLWVAASDRYYQPEEPTPTQAQQLQGMIESVTEETAAIVAKAQAELAGVQQDIGVWEEWDRLEWYKPLNKVARLGSSYLCLRQHSGIDPAEDLDGTYWLLIAKKGDKGDPGVGRDGREGPQGIPGVAVAAEGIIAFNVDEDGYLWMSYTGDEQPGYYIAADGCLYAKI